MRSELAHSRARSEFFKQRSQLLSSQLLESKNSLMRVRRDIVQDVASGGSGIIREISVMVRQLLVREFQSSAETRRVQRQ